MAQIDGIFENSNKRTDFIIILRHDPGFVQWWIRRKLPDWMSELKFSIEKIGYNFFQAARDICRKLLEFYEKFYPFECEEAALAEVRSGSVLKSAFDSVRVNVFEFGAG